MHLCMFFRSDVIKARLATLLPSMQAELEMTEMAGRQVEMEGMDKLEIVKNEVMRWLDERLTEEKNKVVSWQKINYAYLDIQT